jgi:hypothetical protein
MYKCTIRAYWPFSFFGEAIRDRFGVGTNFEPLPLVAFLGVLCVATKFDTMHLKR